MADAAKPEASAAAPATPTKADSTASAQPSVPAAAGAAAAAAPAPTAGSSSTPATPSTQGGGFEGTFSTSFVQKLPESYQFPDEIEIAFIKIKEILAEADKTSCGFLDAAQVQGAITRVPALENELPPEAMKLSIEQGDTDGTGDKINYAKVTEQLRQLLFEISEETNVAKAKDELKDQRPYLLDILKSRASPEGDVSFDAIRDVLTAPPLVIPAPVIASVQRSLPNPGGKDRIKVVRFLHRICPGLNELLFAPIRQKLIDKHHTLKTAFSAMAKQSGTKITIEEMKSGLTALGLDLSAEDMAHVVDVCDYDGSGSVEFDEFVTVFAKGKVAGKRRDQTLKAAGGGGGQAKVMSVAELNAKLLDLVSKDCSGFLSALEAADSDKDGSVTQDELSEALGKCGVDASPQEAMQVFPAGWGDTPAATTLAFKPFVERYSDACHKADDAQKADVVTAIKKEYSGSMLKAFQAFDASEGRGQGKLTSAQMKRCIVGLPGLLIPPMAALRIAKSAEEGGSVTYAGFLRSLGESAAENAEQKAAEEAAKPSPGGVVQGEVIPWTSELEAEVRQMLKGKFDTLHLAFRSFDKDKNGTVDRGEMREGLTKLGLGLTRRQIEAMIQRADADGNGEINYNEFKTLFEMGSIADSRREEQRAKEEKASKLAEAKREKEAKEAKDQAMLNSMSGTPGGGSSNKSKAALANKNPKAEAFMWGSLMSICTSYPEAFAFLKGRADGKHADIISEKEFLQGSVRLNVRMRLRTSMTCDEVVRVMGLPQVAALPSSQRRDILIRSMLFSDDFIRRVNRQMVAAEEGTLDAKNKAAASGKKDKDEKEEQWTLNEDQAKVIFASINTSNSGFITAGEFVHSHSLYSIAHPAVDKASSGDAPLDDVSSTQRPYFPPPRSPPKKNAAKSPFAPDAEVRASRQGLRERKHQQPQAEGGTEGQQTHYEFPGSKRLTPEEARRAETQKLSAERMARRLEAVKKAEEGLHERKAAVEQREAKMSEADSRMKEREGDLQRRTRELEAKISKIEKLRSEEAGLKARLDAKIAEINQRGAKLKEERAALAKSQVEHEKSAGEREARGRDFKKREQELEARFEALKVKEAQVAEAASKQGGVGGKRVEEGGATLGRGEAGVDGRVSAWLGGILEGGGGDVPAAVQASKKRVDVMEEKVGAASKAADESWESERERIAEAMKKANELMSWLGLDKIEEV